ncbi:MAG: hypothetical protein V3T14_03380 [Myxococcota bacterium]
MREALPLWGIVAGAGLALACASRPVSEAVRVDSYELQVERKAHAGELRTVSGYLVSAGTVGEDVCFKVLVDETLRFAPQLLIAQRGQAGEPPSELTGSYRRADPRTRATGLPHERAAASTAGLLSWFGGILPERWSAEIPPDYRMTPSPSKPPEPRAPSRSDGPAKKEREAPLDLRVQLARAEAQLIGYEPKPVSALRQATVIQACWRAPTRSNRETIKHALEWLAPLEKPERVRRAPTLAALRRELQIFYLTRSREYGWAPLAWEEITLTGELLGEGAVYEEEVLSGVDLVPYILGIHDPQRESWLFLDLTTGDSLPREIFLNLLQEGAPGVLRKAGGAALRGGLP